MLLSLNCLQYESYDSENANLEDIIEDTINYNECVESESRLKQFFINHNIEYKTSYRNDWNLRFIVGQCNPIVLIPGIYSTKLNVKIKCKNLYREEKSLYDQIKFYCGRFVCSSTTDNDENRYLWFNIGRSGFSLYRHPWESRREELELLDEDEFESTEDQWDWDNLYGACLGFFMRMFDNEDECPIIERKKKKICGHSHNVRINYHGGFLNDIKRGDCGVRAVSNILESGLKIIPSDLSATNIFGLLAKRLVERGYTKGFSLSAVPYDFRRFISTNTFAYKALEYHIDRMYTLTGKPVIIIAHSFGNLITLNALQKLSADNKKKIKKWISLAPPFGGATKAIDNFLYGTNDFDVDTLWKGNIEFERFGQFLMLRSIPTVYELKPFHIFLDLFENREYSDFAAAIRDRLELEKECYNGAIGKCTINFMNEKSEKFDKLFKDYYPSYLNGLCDIETSHSGNKDALYKKCYTYIYNIIDYPTLIKVDKKIDYNIEDFYKKTGDNFYYIGDCDKLTFSKCYENVMTETKGVIETFEDELNIFINRFKNRYGKEIDISNKTFFETQEEEIEKIKKMIEYQKQKSAIKDLPLPDVDIDIVYSAFNPTLVSEFIYRTNLSLVQKVEKGGDGTVPTWSTLLTAFKWIYEKEKNKKTNNIRLVEYCSRLDSEKLNIKNFKALGCRCLENNLYTKNLQKCSHQHMLGDEKYLFEYIYEEIDKDIEDANKKVEAIKKYIEVEHAKNYYIQQCNDYLYLLSSKDQKLKCTDDIEITEEQYNNKFCSKQGYSTMSSRDCCSIHISGKTHDSVQYDSYYCDNVINNKDYIKSFIDDVQQAEMFYDDNKDVVVTVLCSSSYLNYLMPLFMLIILLSLFD